MKVFISWSKKPSLGVAEHLATFIGKVFTDKVETFLSSRDIKLGQEGYSRISAELKDCDKGIFCFLKNNIRSVWMAYEAGAISMHKSCAGLCDEKKSDNDCPIMPILFQDIESDGFVGHPLESIQRKDFSQELMFNLIKEINAKGSFFPQEKTLRAQFDIFWPSLEQDIKKTLQNYTIGGNDVLDMESLLFELDKRKFPVPVIGEIAKFEEKVTHLSSGFERQELYSILLSKVNRRLCLFGRKNRKLFANDNRPFFKVLKEKLDNGFEFKCLFLDPHAPDVEKKQNVSNFVERLKSSITDAYIILKNVGIAPETVMKAYVDDRSTQIIIADDVTLFSHIRFDDDGNPFPLTDAPFEASKIGGGIGSKIKDTFDKTWTSAKAIDDTFIKRL